MIVEEKPSRLIAVDPRTGRELAVLRTSANALAVGPNGMIIGEGREIGYVRFGGAGSRRADPARATAASPARAPAAPGSRPRTRAVAARKRELCD